MYIIDMYLGVLSKGMGKWHSCNYYISNNYNVINISERATNGGGGIWGGETKKAQIFLEIFAL